MIPKPGLHENVPFATYGSWDAVNQSILKLLDQRTPAHARHEQIEPSQSTEAQDVGSAWHAAVLEPERFEDLVQKAPTPYRRSNAEKAAWGQIAAEHPRAMILRPQDYEDVRGMVDAIWENPTAAEYLRGLQKREVAVVWQDEETGLLCKALLDGFGTHPSGWSVIVDLKSAIDASREGFRRAVAKFGYHYQAAFYLDGLDALAPRPRQFVFLVQEHRPPFCSAVYELSPESIEEGRRRIRQALVTYAECKKRDVWPGYPHRLRQVILPPWAFGEEDDE